MYILSASTYHTPHEGNGTDVLYSLSLRPFVFLLHTSTLLLIMYSKRIEHKYVSL